MRIVSWNVNGLRACERKGFWDYFEADAPDVLCLQEVRADLDQLSDRCRAPEGYMVQFNPATSKKGYSGVATWSREPWEAVRIGLDHPGSDGEGRVVVTEFDGFALYNVYFPNGSRDHSRVGFKLEFYAHLMRHLGERLAAGHGLVVTGDFNTAHREIDLANPRSNAKTTGFLPEERAVIDAFLAMGFHDVFRERHPGEKGHYTWWSNRPGVREKNVGWRIDYFLVSTSLLPRVADARIHPEVPGSDHCPVSLSLAR